MPTVGCEIKVLRDPLGYLEGCAGDPENGRIGAPGLTLTIPAVTIHREQRFPFSAITNSTTGATTKKWSAHFIPSYALVNVFTPSLGEHWVWFCEA